MVCRHSQGEQLRLERRCIGCYSARTNMFVSKCISFYDLACSIMILMMF